MGEAQQTAWKLMRDGALGTVRLIYAEVNHGRIETWHPNPEPFYQVGPLWDVGIYPTTMLTAFFGPVKRVSAHKTILYPDRETTEGRPFRIDTPDFHLAFLEFDSGHVARLTANFYAKGSKQGGSLEFHGDLGRVYLGNFQRFNAPVEFAEFGDEYAAVEYLKEPFDGIEFARAVEELAEAISEDRPQRATGMHAAHVVEVLQGIQTSAEQERPVEITSTFEPPKPMDWAL
jgi:predicted dehydrogenase